MNTKLTFKDFLGLSPHQLNEAIKKPPKPKKRPKGNLWFMHQGLWLNDLNWAHGKNYLLQTAEEEEQTKDFYATDPNSEFCYGVWHGKHGRGITFDKIRPLHAVKHPRIQIKQFVPNN